MEQLLKINTFLVGKIPAETLLPGFGKKNERILNLTFVCCLAVLVYL